MGDKQSLLKTKKELTDANSDLRKRNGALDTNNHQLAVSNGQLVSGNQDLQSKNTSLRQEQMQLLDTKAKLEKQNRLIQARVTARRTIATDPLPAFRIAERLYSETRDRDDRELVINALTLVGLPYEKELKGCTIKDVNVPYMLIVCAPPTSATVYRFEVLNLVSGAIEPVENPIPPNATSWDSVREALAQIVPVGGSWRMLRQKTASTSYTAKPSFGLLGPNGGYMGNSIAANRVLSCASTSYVLEGSPPSGWTFWDFTSDVQRPISSRLRQPLLRGFGGSLLLGCRADGSVAAYLDENEGTMLTLFDKDGQEIKSARTPARRANLGDAYAHALTNFGKWSRDEQFLAIRVNSNVYIWHPSRNELFWPGEVFQDPQTAPRNIGDWAWGAGSELLFATEAVRDFHDHTLEAFDANSPFNSHKILHHFGDELLSIAVSPAGDMVAALDGTGTLSVLQVSDGTVLGTGRHVGAKHAYWAGSRIITATSEFANVPSIRIWSQESMFRANWVYASTDKRSYENCAVVDDGWHWSAAFYHEQLDRGRSGSEGAGRTYVSPDLVSEPRSGVEVRPLFRFAARKDIPENEAWDVAFSPDGQFLAVSKVKSLQVFRTRDWSSDNVEASASETFSYFRRVGDSTYLLSSDRGKHRLSAYRLNFTEHRLEPAPAEFVKLGREPCEGPGLMDQEIEKQFNESSVVQSWEFKLPKNTEDFYFAAGAEWAGRPDCRYNNEHMCDFELVPYDIDRLIQVYDSLPIWNSSDSELDKVDSRGALRH